MTVTVRSFLVAILLAFGLAAPSLASQGSTDSSRGSTFGVSTSRGTGNVSTAANQAVLMVDFAYQPDTIFINVGDTVQWQNAGFQPHTATSINGIWNTGGLERGQSSQMVRFNNPGNYGYFCQFHPFMQGVVVVGGTPPTATVLPTFTPLPPPIGGRSLTVQSGSGQISWLGGGIQSQYYLFRWTPQTGLIFIGAPGAAATSFTDNVPVANTYNCYVLIGLASPNLVGLSDFECRFPNLQSGQAPQSFALRLNQSNTATLSWTAPATSFTEYELSTIRFDGTATQTKRISSGPTSTAEDTQGKATCYALTTLQGNTVIGNTDILCAIPGVSNLGQTPGATQTSAAAALERALDALPRTLGR